MICYCENCKKYFNKEDVEKKRTTYEDFYGVSDSLNGSTPLELEVCPYCENEDITELDDDEVEEKIIDLAEDNQTLRKNIQKKKDFVNFIQNKYPGIIEEYQNKCKGE